MIGLDDSTNLKFSIFFWRKEGIGCKWMFAIKFNFDGLATWLKNVVLCSEHWICGYQLLIELGLSITIGPSCGVTVELLDVLRPTLMITLKIFQISLLKFPRCYIMCLFVRCVYVSMLAGFNTWCLLPSNLVRYKCWLSPSCIMVGRPFKKEKDPWILLTRAFIEAYGWKRTIEP